MRSQSVEPNSDDVLTRSPGIESRALLIIVGFATIASYLVLAIIGRADGLSTDDAMRLVQVRDFLAGQSWFDLTQYRLSPPGTMHWSRLIDAPLAILIGFGQIVMPSAAAERVATVLWPAALLLIFLAGVARLARELAGDAAANLALIFTAAMAAVLQHFRPGAIDHHNVQLVLLIWSLALACRRSLRPRDAGLAGAISALSLAIGVEMMPAIAAMTIAFALRWIVYGETARQTTIAFALSLATVTFGLFIVTVPPVHYGIAACDALSIVHVTAAGIGGIGLAALAAIPGFASLGMRLAGAATLTALLGAIFGLGFSDCLGDPYAQLDPQVRALWLPSVMEARSIATMARQVPQEVPHYYGLAVAALGLGLSQVIREKDGARWGWIISLTVLGTLFIVALWQVRAAAGANALAVVLVPAAMVRVFPASSGRSYMGLSRAALIAAVLLNPLSLIAIGALGAPAVATATGAHRGVVVSGGVATCGQRSDYTPLARLPRGLVLGFIDAGPFLLLETPHSILASPYPIRNGTGMAAMLKVFLGPTREAQARLVALGVDYLAFCAGAPERYNYVAGSPGGFAAALAAGEVPEFLEHIPLEGTALTVYRIRKDL